MGKTRAARPAGSNPDISEADVKAMIDEIRSRKADLVGEKMEYMRRCQPIHEDVSDLIETAAARLGLKKKAIKTKIKQMELREKADEIGRDEDEQVQQHIEFLTRKLGGLADLPLGQAAVKGVTGDVLAQFVGNDNADLRPPFLQDKDKPQAAE